MKNAIGFLLFICFVVSIYPISIYSYKSSKKLQLDTEPIVIQDFIYRIKEKNGNELFFTGKMLEKNKERQVVSNIEGFYMTEHKKYDFSAESGVGDTINNQFILDKNVIFKDNDNYILTDRLIYYKNLKTIKAPQNIKIIYDAVQLEGRDFVYNLATKTFILKNARGRIWLSKIKS